MTAVAGLLVKASRKESKIVVISPTVITKNSKQKEVIWQQHRLWLAETVFFRQKREGVSQSRGQTKGLTLSHEQRRARKARLSRGQPSETEVPLHTPSATRVPGNSSKDMAGSCARQERPPPEVPSLFHPLAHEETLATSSRPVSRRFVSLETTSHQLPRQAPRDARVCRGPQAPGTATPSSSALLGGLTARAGR